LINATKRTLAAATQERVMQLKKRTGTVYDPTDNDATKEVKSVN
jgi:hypothetical protein